ncbi:MAG: glucuronate isomerase [Oscillibacter sp.]|jgi:glucuronate isomerase|nr:glucuronate isomerase [Oscillibacter sp.]MCI9002149.1 glucuronate isomerase [Oscillibacter sp.]
MTGFMDQDFLLSTGTARDLYHGTAEGLPIIDYHCHIDPREIAEDRCFDSVTQVWLGGDHYKWRLMRAAGVPEEKITGGASDWEKFEAFAWTMPQLIGNPIYHWSHLELQRGFGITEPLTPDSARRIYDEANEKLKGRTARQLMRQFDVKAICTTDDPADDLRWHEAIAADGTMTVRVLPAFRPDRAVHIDKPGFDSYIRRLGETVGRELTSAAGVAVALAERVDYFDKRGCLCADHGLDSCMYAPADPETANIAFRKALAGQTPSPAEADAYKTFLTVSCAREYAKRNWVMQIHFGCLRNVNRPAVARMGPDHGHDAVNSRSGAENLGALLNAFLENGGLPKMVVYSLNPSDNIAIDSILACFQGEGVPGRLQHGSAWWFNDSRPGMRAHLTDLASNGVLGRFVGMLTDSRSFLSYTRHEYFRRILCELLGEWVESGQYPRDEERLRRLTADICFHNTNQFFRFGL